MRIEIDRDKVLSPGDIVELEFRTLGLVWIQSTQLALIDWRLKGRKEFSIISWSIPQPDRIIFECRVNKTNPVIVTAAVIGGIIIATAVIGWLTLGKVYQIVTEPAGKILVGGVGAGAIAIAIALLLPMFKGIK